MSLSDIDIIKRNFSVEDYTLDNISFESDADAEAVDRDFNRLSYFVIPASIFYFIIMISLLVVVLNAL